MPQPEKTKLEAQLREKDDFGNGRDVATWADKALEAQANRDVDDGDDEVTLVDLGNALDEMLSTVTAQRGRQPPVAAAHELRPQVASQRQNAAPPTTRTAVKRREKKEEEAEPAAEEEEEAGEAGDPGAPFDRVQGRVLQTLQTVLDEAGVTSLEGAREFTRMVPGSESHERLLHRLTSELGMSPEEASEQLEKWRDAHEELEEIEKMVEMKKRTQGREAIWRCRVCGRADKPYIACYVAPYIVGYRPVGSM